MVIIICNIDRRVCLLMLQAIAHCVVDFTSSIITSSLKPHEPPKFTTALSNGQRSALSRRLLRPGLLWPG